MSADPLRAIMAMSLVASFTGCTMSACLPGLTLVHYSAQLEPFLTQKHTLNTPNTPYHPLNTPETTLNCSPRHTEGA
jgi:hypothetical protein